jgi:hypothetical protein
LHDVIAHNVSVMVVQAAAADDIFDHRPDRARIALRSIETTGREAMAEPRRLLAALGPGADGQGTSPAPDLDRLDDLVEPLRALGMSVDLRHEGDTDVVVPAGVAPAGVALSATIRSRSSVVGNPGRSTAWDPDVGCFASRPSGVDRRVADVAPGTARS